MSDQLKRMYARYRETIHVVGWLILVSFTIGSYWNKWEAQGAELDTHELRIAKLEYAEGQILQNLLDIREFLRVPQRSNP